MDMLFPKFPDFKPLELEDRAYIHDVLWRYNPEISEMTFTNLYIWRGHYEFQWAVYRDWLLIISREGTNGAYAFQPVGPSSRKEATVALLEWLHDERNIENPRIERADERCVAELGGVEYLAIEPLRDHFDYIYSREDLVQLAGNKYRSKRNHINQLLRFYTYEYEPLQEKHIDDCLALQEKWCQMNRCEDDLDLLSEDEAIREILTQYNALHVQGAVIIVGGRVGAFTAGERLNSETVVIHIEKADPDIPGLYQLINQQFCKNMQDDTIYVNREQDLGIEGLRKAKLTYYPDHFVEKYRIKMK
jgi:uncharacterized protein